MIKINYSIYAYSFIFLFSIFSCSPKVTITNSYIFNSAWKDGGYQGFQIAKISLNDSTINVSNDFNKYLLKDHTIDSSFCFGLVSKSRTITTIRKTKIYFNKSDKDDEWFNCMNNDDRREQIGLLSNQTWFKITGLGGTATYFIYIDKSGRSHVFALGPSNW